MARPFRCDVRLTLINCQAVFDTSCTGTVLNLPHHHCNSVYVPWHSNVTPKMRNNIGTCLFYPSLCGLTSSCRNSTPSLDGGPKGSSGARGPPSATLCKLSVSDTTRVVPIECKVRWLVRVRSFRTSRCGRSFRTSSRGNLAFFYVSGGSIDHSRVLKLSSSACSDPQRAWEGPRGSLTTVLCKYLGQYTTYLPRSSPSNPI